MCSANRYGAALVAVAIDDDAWNNRPTARNRLYEFMHAWDAHWTRYENSEWAHIRSGWVNVDATTVTNGATQRIVRLSYNGTTDVVNERTWLDDVVRVFVDPERFPPACMPTMHPAPTPSDNVAGSSNTVNPNDGLQVRASNASNVNREAGPRVGVVEPQLSLTPIISQIERMQTE